MTYWAIPAKSPRQELARAFLDFATEPQQLAAVAQRFPYGPTRTSALALTKQHLSAGLDLQAYLPTAPANLKTALSVDEGWWAENSERLEAAFAEWLAKRPERANSLCASTAGLATSDTGNHASARRGFPWPS